MMEDYLEWCRDQWREYVPGRMGSPHLSREGTSIDIRCNILSGCSGIVSFSHTYGCISAAVEIKCMTMSPTHKK